METDELRAFVVEAHANGYATSEAVETNDGRKAVEFERGDWRYVDRYVGSRDFLGAETVRYRGDPVWGMHYDGRLTGADADPDAVYGFLRSALARVPERSPFRGPDFERGEFAYESRVDGDLSRFEGTETIRAGERTVYEGPFAGGRID